jgi:predicted nucleotidyltransferase
MTQAEMQADQSAPALPPLVQRTLARLIRAFAPERVVLFGSHAKGTARDKSDVDLLVIANVEGNPAIHQRRAKQLAGDCFPPVDVVIATPTEVAEAANAKSPFLLSILGSGKTVYSRPKSAASDSVDAGSPGS